MDGGRAQIYSRFSVIASGEAGESPKCTEADPYPWVVDRLRSVLSALGAILTGAGVLILLFVAYQLWGTGLYTSRQQGSLRSEFNDKLKAAGAGPSTTSTTVNPANLPPPPPSGESVATIRIPKIGVDKTVVQGVGLADLRKAPGHYPETPLPGEQGNAAIAGHRTTYGAPFNRLDELADGDEILVTHAEGKLHLHGGRHQGGETQPGRGARPDADADADAHDLQPEVLGQGASGRGGQPGSGAESHGTHAHRDHGAGAGRGTGRCRATARRRRRAGQRPLEGADDPVGRAHGRSSGSAGGSPSASAATGSATPAAIVPFFVSLFFFYAHLELLLPANF